MTKQEHKLKTMLNYYEVNLTGGKDEKLNKTDLNKFIDFHSKSSNNINRSQTFIFTIKFLEL